MNRGSGFATRSKRAILGMELSIAGSEGVPYRVNISDELYPENLRPLDKAPDDLYVEGDLRPRDRLSVAIVGTRSPTGVGKAVAFEIARDVASAGVTVVSGLASGIDAAAHAGALEGKGRTIACLGAGVDVVYPRCNSRLFREIPSHGALVSEYETGVTPLPWRFPARNRIIAGISLGVLVIEAGPKSGALITADWSLKFGRPVMAVPGSVKSSVSEGANKLIQDGAYLATCAADVLSYLGRETEYVPQAAPGRSSPDRGLRLTLEESMVLEKVREEVMTADQVAEKVDGSSPGMILAILSSLEVKGIVQRVAGGKYLAKT